MTIRIEVVPLGTSSGTPTRERGVSALLLKMDSRCLLLDCGDGTQQRAIQAGMNIHALDAIFITHLHGDHVYGLPALLSTLSLQGRTQPLALHGPHGLAELLRTVLRVSQVHLTFPLRIREIQPGLVWNTENLKVSCAMLDHRIQAFGYRFDALRGGARRSVTYCTDTRPCESSVHLARGSDLLIHEATYLHELADKARERGHSTARQAAEIAKSAEVSWLMLTHFSPRYRDLGPLLQDARDVFPWTVVAQDYMPFDLGRQIREDKAA
ncbi:MAG TPA: ribonuclease Z [Bdellovibrionota bacterium]|nr:ribonuclease Z [Bdellovibrionota bacterium]